jgi:hypothetical protein
MPRQVVRRRIADESAGSIAIQRIRLARSSTDRAQVAVDASVHESESEFAETSESFEVILFENARADSRAEFTSMLGRSRTG